MKISPTSFVTIDFLIRVGEDQWLPESRQPETLSFCMGQGVLPPDLEEAMLGLTVNDSRVVTLSAAQAYGEIDPALFQEVPRSDFDPAEELEPGMVFETKDRDGNSLYFIVKEVKGDTVVIDFNHPLAGKDLEITFNILEVREATPADLAPYKCPACQEGKPHQH